MAIHSSSFPGRIFSIVAIVVFLAFMQFWSPSFSTTSITQYSSNLRFSVVSSLRYDNNATAAAGNRTPAVTSVSANTEVFHGRPDLLEYNYFFSSLQDERLLQQLPPLQILKTYIQQHSQQQLENEWEECIKGGISENCKPLQNRQYLSATYACPMEAGNRMHRTMNGLLWAILTNRTLLYRYNTVEVCQQYKEFQHPKGNDGAFSDQCPNIFKSAGLYGNQTDCEGILHLHDWVPSFDEWSDRLGINATSIVSAEINQKQQAQPATLPYDSENSPHIIRTGQQLHLDPGGILTFDGTTTRHLQDPQNLERLQLLRSLPSLNIHAVYFIYGLLFEALFTMEVPNLMGIESGDENDGALSIPLQQPSKDIETYFLHSRHVSTNLSLAIVGVSEKH